MFYKDLSEDKKNQLLQVSHDPEATLRRFYKVIIHYLTRLVVKKWIS